MKYLWEGEYSIYFPRDLTGNSNLIYSIFALSRKSTLADLGITHIVSVLKYDFKDFEDWEKYEHLGIEVDDVEDENLLGEFERTSDWIERGLEDGKDGRRGSVLIHW